MSKQQGSIDFSQKGSMQSTLDQVHLTPSSYSVHQVPKDLCIHHPEKKAKYILTIDPTQYLKVCSKCAIKYALENHQVQEIESHLDDKQRQTNSFLQQLNETKGSVQTYIDKMGKKEASLKDFYEKQYQKVVGFYFNIESKIQQTKQMILQELSEFQWKSLDQINSNRIQCKQILQTISQFLGDIQSNYEKIVTNPDTLPFNQIMGGYSSKLHKLQKHFLHITENKVELIEFRGVNDKVMLELEMQIQNLARQPSSPLSDSQRKFEVRSHSEESRINNTLSPDLNQKQTKRLKQSNSKIIASLLFGLNQYQNNRNCKTSQGNHFFQNNTSAGRTIQKTVSKTPEVTKKQSSYPVMTKNSPKFLFRNYYK